MKSDLPHDGSDPAWEKLAAAVRRGRATDAQEQAPFGFATRVAAAWQDLRKNERAALWARWSLRAAFCSVIVALIVAVLQRQAPPAEILPVPVFDMP